MIGLLDRYILRIIFLMINANMYAGNIKHNFFYILRYDKEYHIAKHKAHNKVNIFMHVFVCGYSQVHVVCICIIVYTVFRDVQKRIAQR